MPSDRTKKVVLESMRRLEKHALANPPMGGFSLSTQINARRVRPTPEEKVILDYSRESMEHSAEREARSWEDRIHRYQTTGLLSARAEEEMRREQAGDKSTPHRKSHSSIIAEQQVRPRPAKLVKDS